MKNLLYMIIYLITFCIFLILGPQEALSQEVNWQQGPKTFAVADNQINIYISGNYAFTNKKNAEKFLKKYSIKTDNNLIGLIKSSNENETWFMTLEYLEVGYIEEKYLISLNPDDFLNGMKLATEGTNKFNFSLAPKVKVLGFAEKPVYLQNNKQLRTAVSIQQGKKNYINYVILILGRKGVINVKLICNEEEFTQLKSSIDFLIENIQFNSSNKYSKFDPQTDKIAFANSSEIINLFNSRTGNNLANKNFRGVNNQFSQLSKASPVNPNVFDLSYFKNFFIYIGLVVIVIVISIIKFFFSSSHSEE